MGNDECVFIDNHNNTIMREAMITQEWVTTSCTGTTTFRPDQMPGITQKVFAFQFFEEMWIVQASTLYEAQAKCINDATSGKHVNVPTLEFLLKTIATPYKVMEQGEIFKIDLT